MINSLHYTYLRSSLSPPEMPITMRSLVTPVIPLLCGTSHSLILSPTFRAAAYVNFLGKKQYQHLLSILHAKPLLTVRHSSCLVDLSVAGLNLVSEADGIHSGVGREAGYPS